MSVYEKYIPVITEAAALREVYGPHAAKKIARDFDVAIVTAKTWLSGRFPMARHDELVRRIQAELDRRDAMSAAIRRRWGLGDVGEKDRAVVRRRAVAPGAPADGVGRSLTGR